MRLAIIGAGWAGLAAAVRAVQAGHDVVLLEMAGHAGGRARSVQHRGLALDNGQHILIGAYRRTLDLMRTVGVDESAVLQRRPLELRHADGRGLRMPAGPPGWVLGWAVWRTQGWSTRDKLALIATATGWLWRGFRCPPGTSVDTLCRGLPGAVRELLIDPLCVAALNTPAPEADAQVFLRVLRDALFGGTGSADLLLPRVGLDAVLPLPALSWLQAHGATVHRGRRVNRMTWRETGWYLDDETASPYDGVVLACPAAEASRLAQPHAPRWAAVAAELRYEPIVTVWLRGAGASLPCPMLALAEGPQAPAQFAFDHGALGGEPGRLVLVISGARPWVELGLPDTAQRALQQMTDALPPRCRPQGLAIEAVMAEKRATFRCTPELTRPPAAVAPHLRLWAAGDYVAGPYPATLEGAVRAGEAAVARMCAPGEPPAG